MKPYPALAILEFEDISAGMLTVDRVIKKAPIGTLRHGTVSGGHYLVVFSGSTASVEESYNDISPDGLIDQTILQDIDESLYAAITDAARQPARGEAVVVIESPTVASLAQATERALKSTNIDLIEFRMADADLDGKSLVTLHGELYDIQEASRLIGISFEGRNRTCRQQIITSPHNDFTRGINLVSSFGASPTLDLEGE